jgi:hypothetical protein
MDHPGKEITPLVLSLTGFDESGTIHEEPRVRNALDALLSATDNWDIETIAFTIFPDQLYKIVGQDRVRLFELYAMVAPRYHALNSAANGRGLYFERLTMFGRGPYAGNQLEFIIQQHAARPGVRRSMFQAAVFDPGVDHVRSAQLGFPCLQHVSFVPTPGGLVLNAFYATQQLFDKAYGNYLGLCRLGAFMSREMGVRLARVNVFVGVLKLERINKGDSRILRLAAIAKACLEAAPITPAVGSDEPGWPGRTPRVKR